MFLVSARGAAEATSHGSGKGKEELVGVIRVLVRFGCSFRFNFRIFDAGVLQERLAPKFFSTGDNWRAFLKEEGYAVLSDVLPGDAVAEALKLLLEDLQILGQGLGP